MKQLPDTPSALIRLALDDLRKIEGDDRYAVDMYNWHCPSPLAAKCYVCLAGAVMAKSIELDPNIWASPTSMKTEIDAPTRLKLCALDDFRTGSIFQGLSTFYDKGRYDEGSFYNNEQVRAIYKKIGVAPGYWRNYNEDFYVYMNKLADELQAIGH